jgi:uncharacterized membrane protein YciS (DUF1049 family)
METVLVIMAIGLGVGWAVVGWLLHQTAVGAAKIEQRLEALERRVEKS